MMLKPATQRLLLLLVAMLAVAGNGLTQAPRSLQQDTTSILNVLQGIPWLSNFSTIVAASGDPIYTISTNASSVTVFAPDNDAVQYYLGLAGVTLEEFIQDQEEVTSVLMAHYVNAVVKYSAATTAPMVLDTLAPGDTISVQRFGRAVYIDETAFINEWDIPASVGSLIHVVDRVLLPFPGTPLEQVFAENPTYLSMFAEAVKAVPEIDAFLQDPASNATIVAPSNEAFNIALVEMGLTWEELLADTATLSQLLAYHIVPVYLSITPVTEGLCFPNTLLPTLLTAGGVPYAEILFNMNARDWLLYANDAEILLGVYEGPNKNANVIDKVLTLPQNQTTLASLAAEDPDLSMWLEAANAIPEIAQLINHGYEEVTMFAPTNKAFMRSMALWNTSWEDYVGSNSSADFFAYRTVWGTIEPSSVSQSRAYQFLPTFLGPDGDAPNELKLHANNGGRYVDDARIVGSQLVAGPSRLHVIDVAIHPVMVTREALGNYGNLALRSPELDTFFAAVIAAPDVLDMLKDPAFEGSVFLPTNEAFAAALFKLNVTVEELLANTPLLTEILQLHIVPGNQIIYGTPSDDLCFREMVPTAGPNASIITVYKDTVNNAPRVNTANVISADIFSLSSDANAHLIDKVLLPSSIDPDTPAVVIENLEEISTFYYLASSVPRVANLLNDPAATFTVFAPSNAAFERFAEYANTTVEQLVDFGELEQLIMYHFVDVRVQPFRSMPEPSLYPTLAGPDQLLNVSLSGVASANTAQITAADIVVGSGFLNIVDEVLVSSSFATQIGPFGQLALNNNDVLVWTQYMTAAGGELAAMLVNPNVTVSPLVPRASAWDVWLRENDMTQEELLADTALLTELLSHMILAEVVQLPDLGRDLDNTTCFRQHEDTLLGPGSFQVDLALSQVAMSADEAAVLASNLPATQSLVHIISQLLAPPSLAVTPLRLMADMPEISLFVQGVNNSEMLRGLLDNPTAAVTIFAPNNLAIEAALRALNMTVGQWLAMPNQTAVSAYNILGLPLPVEVAPANGFNYTTIEGAQLTWKQVGPISRKTYSIEDATIIDADIMVGISYLHIISSVLIPPEMLLQQAGPLASLAIKVPDLQAMAAAVNAAPEVQQLLMDPAANYTIFAPTTRALARFADDANTTIDELLQQTELLTEILSFHMVPGGNAVDMFALGAEPANLTTVLGGNETLAVAKYNGITSLAGNDLLPPPPVPSCGPRVAEVVTLQLESYSVTVNLIDEVLLPSSLSNAPFYMIPCEDQ